ncbi:hypothetical protein, partial [Meiothermus hypogaeus]|uniref:hypothetical protein n=1 Tax=Meiothermus hypogaeus TaxID=884155 RepID=UPI001C99F5AA
IPPLGRETLSSPTDREGCTPGFKKTASGVFVFVNCLFESGISHREWAVLIVVPARHSKIFCTTIRGRPL